MTPAKQSELREARQLQELQGGLQAECPGPEAFGALEFQ